MKSSNKIEILETAPLKSVTKTGGSVSPLLFNIILEIKANAIKEGIKQKRKV